MEVGDLVKRIDPMQPTHLNGVVVGFDRDGDPIILWNNGVIEEEYANQVEVVK